MQIASLHLQPWAGSDPDMVGCRTGGLSVHLPRGRYSAIRCAGADPLPSDVRRQSPEMAPVAPLEMEAKKSAVNGGTAAANKGAAKQQKGIMGMFNKTTSKTPESSKEVKMEENEDTAAVSLCLRITFQVVVVIIITLVILKSKYKY